jgi:hypothetical protein
MIQIIVNKNKNKEFLTMGNLWLHSGTKFHQTCHGSSLCKLAQVCPTKGPLPGTHFSMSWRACAMAYTALYTLYSGLRFETSRNSVFTVARFS